MRKAYGGIKAFMCLLLQSKIGLKSTTNNQNRAGPTFGHDLSLGLSIQP